MNSHFYRLLLYLCFIPLFAGAQSKYDFIFHKSYAERSTLFDTVVFRELDKLEPVRFYRQIDELHIQAKKEGDHGMEIEAILGRYEYMDKRELTNFDEKIAVLEKLLNGLNKKKYPEYTALIMFDLGSNYFGKKFNYTRAFEYFINTYNLIKTMSSHDFPDKKNVLVNMGNKYYNFGDLDKAREMLLDADSLPPSRVKVTNYNNSNTLGLVYRSTGKYDSAVYYFQKTLALAERNQDTVWIAIVSGNIGICYYLQNDFAPAIPLLKKDVSSCFKFGRSAYDNGMNSLLILADMHLKMDSIDAVAADIALAKQYIDSCRDKMKPLSMFYPILAKYYYKKGDFLKAYIYEDSAATYKDRLAERDNVYKLAKVEQKKELEKHETELQKLTAEKKLVEYTRNGLIVMVLFVSLITILAINRQRLKKELAERELHNATRQLEKYTRHLQEKNALIERSSQEIEKLQALLSNTQEQQENNEVLQQLYSSTILTDEEWDEFKQLFDRVHTGYLHRLTNKMPELSPADKRFIVLSKLNLTNKEMAGILGVQADTIRSYKHRLRKKFDLPEDANIKEFVDAI